MEKNLKNLKVAFFGTPEIAVYVLDELKTQGIVPELIITAPDKPKGRKLTVTPPETKLWAQKHNIAILQPEKLNDANFLSQIKSKSWDIFIVVAYGKIIPESLFEIPSHGTLNVHPSLLPRLRGPSPIQSAILGEEKTGVTVMLLDEQMDHGPIVAQRQVEVASWPPKASMLGKILAEEGARLLAQNILPWIDGKIKATAQDDSAATYTKKIKKTDGLVDLSDTPEENYRKIQAFDVWPRAYFIIEKNGKQMRVVITDAELKEDSLVIKSVIPEGKKEMLYADFLRGNS